MKYFVLFLFLVTGNTLSIHGQNQEKIDSILALIRQTPTDTVKARHYLELSNLTMYSDQVRTQEYRRVIS